MTKKLTFDALPATVEKILEILSSEGSEHTALSELVQRIALIEKKIDYLQKTVSPDRPVMDMQTVCKVLKLRPKAVSELAMSGVLPSRAEGRRTLFYEDAVVKYFMTQPAWGAAVSESASARSAASDPTPMDIASEGRQRIDINAASEILGRSAAAIYQLTANNRVPYHKDGTKVYFYIDELRQWVQSNPARQRRKK